MKKRDENELPDLSRTTLQRDPELKGTSPEIEGPSIYPGMEDAGIGSRAPEADPFDSDDSYYDEDDLDFGGLDEEDLHDLDSDDPDADDRNEDGTLTPAGRRRRLPYLYIACAFIALFIMLAANLVYFNVRKKDTVLNSPYNKRQSSLADRVIRGSIKSSDGHTLAYTEVYDGGEEERIYPYANIFAHTVGYLTHGRSGIESFANYQLLTSHNNIVDQIINEFLRKKNPGDTVVTTLNAELQEAAYYALGDYRGAIVVMEPKTGAVRAMVSKPDFDPNTLASIWDEMVSDPSNSQLLNRATQGLYPPGSTFKIITSLAYLRKNRTFENFEYDCTGELEIGDSVVHCYKDSVHGLENFSQAFSWSCNTAFSQIGLDIGARRLTDTAKDMMFGVRMPSELYTSRTRWQLTSLSDEVELVQTAFGQGKTLTTPYHMALICAAIANDGVIMEPQLIERIENKRGDVISRTSPKTYKKLLPSDEASALEALMREVVESGTASELSGRGYTAAGKTGSAEYYKNDGSIGTHSWFVGFTDPDDPDCVIAVVAENGGAGSSTAVPIAGVVLDAFYRYVGAS